MAQEDGGTWNAIEMPGALAELPVWLHEVTTLTCRK